eukprot:s949_g5.t1
MLAIRAGTLDWTLRRVPWALALILGAGRAVLKAGSLGSRATWLKDLRDQRLALYSPKHRRDTRAYRNQVLAVAGLQISQAPEPRKLRRRSGSAALEEKLPCVVSVHHGLCCLQRAVEAWAAGVRLRVESVLLPWNCPKEVQELALEVAPGKVYMVPQHLTRSLFRSTDGTRDESHCRFAVAFPFSQPLSALVPPIVVLDGLGSTYNFAMLYLPCRITSRKFLSKLQRASRPEANSAMALRLTLSLLTALVAAEPVLFEPSPFAGGQLRGQAEDIDPFGGVEEPGRSDKWLRDISTRTKNHFKKLLQPLQTPIVQEYQVLTILDGYVNYTMQLVSNATGHEVVWNRTGRFLSEEPRALAPRKQELPPRARYINKILIYLNKEMEVVWNLKTIVDRKRWGVRCLQDQKIDLVIRIKPDIEEHENKYAKQLQADYESLVHNINDASQKISDLRTRLWKMEDFAKQFIALPSGAMNLGQLIKTARCLGVVSFVVTSAAWSALNGRAAAVSDGWMYFASFHRTESAPEALRALKQRGLRLIAAEDFFERPAAVERGQKQAEDWALVLGAEDEGVSTEALALCDTGISVPQVRGASLNVATAAALCLYELTGRPEKMRSASEEMRDFLETLDPPQVTQRLVSFTAKRRWRDALELLQDARRVELQRNLVHCNAALSVCAAARSWRSALELLRCSPGLQKDIITQNAATTSCEKASRWQLCQDLLCASGRDALRRDAASFNAAAGAAPWLGAMEVLRKMAASGVQRTAVTSTIQLAPLAAEAQPPRILCEFRRLLVPFQGISKQYGRQGSE